MQHSNRTTDPRPLLKVTDFARMASVSPRLIHNLVQNGDIAAIRFGRVIRIRPEVADEILKTGVGGPASRQETAEAA